MSNSSQNQNKMKAIQKTENGVEIVEIAKPTPKEKEVLINVALAGYCRTDSYVAKDILKTKKPLTLGHEFSGVVEEIGKNVSTCSVGDHVAVMPILKENDYYCGKMLGVDIDGAFAEFVVVPEELIYHIPKTVSFIHAAYAEPIAASLAVTRVAKPKDSKGVVVGKNRIAGLTHHLLEVSGFKNVKIMSLEELKSMPKETFDFAIETFVDQDSINEIIRTLRFGGVCVLKSRIQKEVSINIGIVVKKEITIQGLYYGDFQQALNLLAENKLAIENYLGKVISYEDAIGLINSEPGEDKKVFFTNKKEFLKRL